MRKRLVMLVIFCAAGAPLAAQSSGTVQGSIVDELGRPIGDAVLTLSGGRRAEPRGELGRFTIAGLAPGVYSGTVTTRNHGTLAIRFDISGGRTTDVGRLVVRRGPQHPRTYVGLYREVGTTRTVSRERLGGTSDVVYEVIK